MNKCMEIRVEGRITIGKPRKSWIDNVEGDMSEQDIDRNQSCPLQREVEKGCFEEKVQTNWKMDCKLIII